MADNAKYLQAQPFTLAGAGCILGATSITLNAMTQIDGVTLVTMSDFGNKGFATIEPGNGTREEQISFTGITQNVGGSATLTGVSNVAFNAPYTETSGTLRSHPGGVTLIITNTSGFYNRFVSKVDDETITSVWTFDDSTGRPKLLNDVDTAVATEFVDFGQLSRQAIAGASNASTTVKGIVQLPTQAQTDAKTTTGSTGALLAITPDVVRSTLLSDYVADTGAADAYAIAPSPAISAYATGQIFSFKATHTNTTTSTLDVNSKGVKTIKKQDGATNLAAGDIVSGQVVIVEYDGSNFQMLNPVGNIPATVGQLKFGGDGSDGALSIAAGTTTINLGGNSVVIKNYTSISITGTGQLAFSNPSSTGTTIILKSQGNVTLTSSTIPNIDASGMGAAGGAASTGVTNPPAGNNGTTALGIFDDSNHHGTAGTAAVRPNGGAAGAAGAIYTNLFSYTNTEQRMARVSINIAPGSGGAGGGSGDSNTNGGSGGGGAGGNGGAALILECGGAINFTSALGISVAGKDGAAGTSAITTGANSDAGGGGGGGGAGGFAVVLYNIETATSGSINTAGGAGGAGGSSQSGNQGGGSTGGGGAGGGGAGCYGGAGGAGGAGGNSNAVGAAGSAAGGARAGGGGGGGSACANDNSTLRAGGAAGSAGASQNVLVVKNNYFT